ncbi:MAG: T9SS type A sorting domain-containing protein [Calditrichaeota bacterium]|nr:T9SS type A sorting domain-containing protein [Calditrichota bacterium]
MKRDKFFWLLFILLPASLWSQITWTKTIITDTLTGAKKHAVVDLDNDGDYDIVVTLNPEGAGAEDPSRVNVTTFINNGNEVFTAVDVDFEMFGARGLAVGDLNGDGYPDIVAGNAASTSPAWFENDQTPGDGGWVKRLLGGYGFNTYEIQVKDLDQDGDLDIIDGMGDDASGGTLVTDSLRWFENNGANPPAFTARLIATYSTPIAIFIEDFDGDNDWDVVAGQWVNLNATPSTDDDVRWWAQNAGSWTQQQIIEQTYGANGFHAVDLDRDNDIDIVGAGYKAQSIDWWANDGTGTFGTKTVIKSNFTYTRDVFVVDVDGDTDLDIVACADNDNTVSWFENDGSLNFTEHVITTTFTYAYFVTAADMDGDGDVDIIGTAQDAWQLAWWANDQDDNQYIAAGDQPPTSFWNGKVVIDFVSGDAGNVSVFYNHNENANRNKLATGVDHIAVSGFYTIKTDKSTYQCDITFSYDGISEWSAIDNEQALIICAWDETNQQWYKVGTSQTVDDVNNTILVTGLTSELKRYSKFTLGSSTPDNPLPVQLVSFTATSTDEGIELTWETQSELNNLGFELWRKSDWDTTFQRIASYEWEDALVGLGNSNLGKVYRYLDRRVEPGMTYVYKLYDVDLSGRRYEQKTVLATFTVGDLVKVRGLGIPRTLVLGQNYPNPFNHRTVIEFGVPKNADGGTSRVNVQIFDMLGRPIRTLFQGNLVAGNYLTTWDGRDESGRMVASGNYIYVLKVNNRFVSKRLTLLR